jgi:4-hydroxythreonine-4-phosphate dehydrogenase
VSRAAIIAISMGDPGGIGPEVILRALDDGDVRRRARWLIFGHEGVMEQAARACGAPALWHTLAPNFVSSTLGELRAGEVGLVEVGAWRAEGSRARADAAAGALSFQCVRGAIERAQLPRDHPWRASAVVTGPISKEAWALAGHGKYPGHTELFAEAFGAKKWAMMFHAGAWSKDERGLNGPAPEEKPAPGLNVILVTTHRPLRTVPDALTSERIVETIELGALAMRELGVAAPRIGVCGLNPHAGEHGLLGEEDDRVIAPAIARARSMGIDASGPWPADTIFQGALSFDNRPPARFDLVVAMYHDQGLIPLKTLAWDRAVNMTVGLEHEGRPVLRTSPDHGTAFDIAGRGIANPGSMKAALRLAADWARTDS